MLYLPMVGALLLVVAAFAIAISSDDVGYSSVGDGRGRVDAIWIIDYLFTIWQVVKVYEPVFIVNTSLTICDWIQGRFLLLIIFFIDQMMTLIPIFPSSSAKKEHKSILRLSYRSRCRRSIRPPRLALLGRSLRRPGRHPTVRSAHLL